MGLLVAACAISVGLAVVPAGAAPPGAFPPPLHHMVTFGCTANIATWTVPNGVHSVVVDAAGAQGGKFTAPSTATPGLGGHVSGVLNVTPGQFLYVDVGCQGGTPAPDGPGGPGGFNGGGDGGAGGLCLGSDFQEFPCESGGPGGGGASDVTAVLPGKVFQRLIVAGGGGAPGGGAFSFICCPAPGASAFSGIAAGGGGGSGLCPAICLQNVASQRAGDGEITIAYR